MTPRVALACFTAGLSASASAGQARILDATVLDKIYPAEQVAQGMEGSLRSLGACFRPGPEDAGATRGEVAFEIAPNGKPAHVNVSGDLDPGCTERESSRWRFVHPSGETPQVFVTLELSVGESEGSAPDRERGEMEALCSLIQQLQPRTQDPAELTRKALRTLLASGMTSSGQRWAIDMLHAPAQAQLAEFQAAASERGIQLECPEYVGFHERTFGAPKAGIPFEWVLVAAEGPSLKVLVRNRSVSSQWLLVDHPLQTDELVLLDAQGKVVPRADARAARKESNALPRTAYRSLPGNSAIHLREEVFRSDGARYALTWGPYSFGPLAPGDYRARVKFSSTHDEAEGLKGGLPGVWKGSTESNEVRFTLR